MDDSSHNISENIVRVRGLPWSSKEEDIRKFFHDCASLKEIHFTYSKEGRPSGEAYLEFEDPDDVDRALTHYREHMGQRYIEVFHAKRNEMEYVLQRSGKPCPGNAADNVVRLRGLPYNCTKEDVMDFFKGLELTTDGIVFGTDKSGRASGEGFVRFKNKESTEKALDLHMEKIGHSLSHGKQTRKMRSVFLICLLYLMLLAESHARSSSGGRTTRGGIFGSAKSMLKSMFKPRPKPAASYRGTSSYGGTSSYSKPKTWNSYRKPTTGYVAPIKPPSRGSKTKSILAGLAAGYVGYKLTKGASRLMHNGIRYYPANNYYSEYPAYSSSPSYGASSIRVRCEYDLPEEDVNSMNITMANGARATKLIYECDFNTQMCCGVECCNKSSMG